MACNAPRPQSLSHSRSSSSESFLRHIEQPVDVTLRGFVRCEVDAGEAPDDSGGGEGDVWLLDWLLASLRSLLSAAAASLLRFIHSLYGMTLVIS